MASLSDRGLRNRGRDATGISGRILDTLPIAYVDRPDDRLLVIGATLVAAAAVVGKFVADETIVLLGIEPDIHGPDDQPTDD